MSHSRSKPLLRVWLYFLLVLLPLTSAWSLTNPMFAAPDETTHLVRAQGVVRGDSSSPYDTDGISGEVCFAFDGNVTANCQNLTWDSARVTTNDNADEYPPMFHFVAGIPSLFVSGLGGAYVARLWLACICSSLLALAAGLLWLLRPQPWVAAGFLLGCTPMVIFLSATVNPSGLTVALASVIWASGITITAQGSGRSSAYPIFLAAASLFPMLRRDALFIEMIIFAVLVSLTHREAWPALARQRWIQATAAIVTLTGGLSFLVWSGSAASSFARSGDNSFSAGLLAGLGDLQYYLLSVMGWFGWLDTPMTNETYSVAIAVLGTAMTVAFAASSGVLLRSMSICFLSVMTVPVAIGMLRHPYFQGRYLLPLTVGLFILIGFAMSEAHFPHLYSRRLMTILLLLWAGVHFFAFAQNLRRYATGVRGSWNLVDDAAWHSPVFSNGIALGIALASIMLGCAAMWALFRSSLSTDDTGQMNGLATGAPAHHISTTARETAEDHS